MWMQRHKVRGSAGTETFKLLFYKEDIAAAYLFSRNLEKEHEAFK